MQAQSRNAHEDAGMEMEEADAAMTGKEAAHATLKTEEAANVDTETEEAKDPDTKIEEVVPTLDVESVPEGSLNVSKGPHAPDEDKIPSTTTNKQLQVVETMAQLSTDRI